jgi:hypothetical protein
MPFNIRLFDNKLHNLILFIFDEVTLISQLDRIFDMLT